MVLNEPETSLHPDLLAPLARLIGAAAARMQVVVVSHAAPLVEALTGRSDCTPILLEKELGETVAAGLMPPRWIWPSRRADQRSMPAGSSGESDLILRQAQDEGPHGELGESDLIL